MGSGDDKLGLQGLPACIGDRAAGLVRAAARLDGAIILFDADDNIAWVNDRQRAMMPCSTYIGRSYSELFWEAARAGLLGSAAARHDPEAWLRLAIIERAGNSFAQTINEYAFGRVALSNRRLDDGWTIQLRHPVGDIGSVDPESVLLAAVQATRDVAALRRALDQLAVGVGILDTDGRMIYANAAMSDVVGSGIGLAPAAQATVEPLHPADLKPWHASLQAAASGAASRMVMRDRGGRPVLAGTFMTGEHPDTAILLAAPIRQHLSPAAAAWLEELGVRAAEVDVIGLMLGGHNTAAIARRRQVSPSTVLAQMSRARKALRQQEIVVDSPGQVISLAQQMSAITRAQSAHGGR